MDKEILLNFKNINDIKDSKSYECRNCYSLLVYFGNPSYEGISLSLSHRLMNCEKWREKQFLKRDLPPPMLKNQPDPLIDPDRCDCGPNNECWH